MRNSKIYYRSLDKEYTYICVVFTCYLASSAYAFGLTTTLLTAINLN